MVRIHSPRPNYPFTFQIDAAVGAFWSPTAVLLLCPVLCPPRTTRYAACAVSAAAGAGFVPVCPLRARSMASLTVCTCGWT